MWIWDPVVCDALGRPEPAGITYTVEQTLIEASGAAELFSPPVQAVTNAAPELFPAPAPGQVAIVRVTAIDGAGNPDAGTDPASCP